MTNLKAQQTTIDDHFYQNLTNAFLPKNASKSKDIFQRRQTSDKCISNGQSRPQTKQVFFLRSDLSPTNKAKETPMIEMKLWSEIMENEGGCSKINKTKQAATKTKGVAWLKHTPVMDTMPLCCHS